MRIIRVAGVLAGVFLSLALSARAAAPTARIGFIRGDSVYVAGPDGSHARRLGEGRRGPALSPDGTKLSVLAQSPDADDVDGLTVYDTSSGAHRTYRAARLDFLLSNAGFSADDRYAAYVGDTLEVVDTRTGKLTALTGSESSTANASWAPTGADRLVYDGDDGLSVWSAGSQTVSLATRIGRGEIPVWGPALIAYERDGQIWTVRPDGTQARQRSHYPLGRQGAMYPIAWSPSGTYVLAQFDGGTDATAGQTVLVNVRAGTARHLSVHGDNAYPMGFADGGQRIVVYDGDLTSLSLSGTGARTLVRDAGDYTASTG